jgi:Uma2 family endonuclease
MPAVTVDDYEVKRGKPMPSKNHGIVQSSLICALKESRDKFTVISELSLELDGQPLVPDVSVFPKLPIDWHNDEIKLTVPPAWVIEILSPTQALDDLVKKADTYFAAGVKSCWIVQPSLGLVAVLTPDADPEFHSSGIIVDPATGIEVPVKEIFQ